MGNIFIKLDEMCCGRELKVIQLEKKLCEMEEIIEEIIDVSNCCMNPLNLCKK